MRGDPRMQGIEFRFRKGFIGRAGGDLTCKRTADRLVTFT